MSWAIIAHSAKGSEWDEKNRKYLKREGTPGKMEDTGKYYYPDSYEGGRHLPKGETSSKKTDKKEEHAHEYGSDMQDWEKKVHDHLSTIIQKNPDMFKDTASVVAGIMDDKNLDAVKNTLKAFGVNADKMTDGEVKQLRQKIADFYTKNDKAVEEARAGKKVSSEKKADEKDSTKKSSSKKSGSSSKKKSSKKTDTKTEGSGGGSSTSAASSKSSSGNKNTAVGSSVYNSGNTKTIKEKKATARREAAKNSRYEGGYSGKKKKLSHSIDFVSEDFLAHHGVLGQKWGIRRFQNKDGSRTEAGKKRARVLTNQVVRSSGSRKSDTLTRARKEDINKLSDEELRRYNKRLQDERQFAELTKGEVGAGKKAVLNMAGSITTAIVTSIAIEAGKKVLKSKLGL